MPRTVPAGETRRAKRFYYEENPDRWAAETQSDVLWLTGEESRSLVPSDARVGARIDAPSRIQRRLFGTLGIDYMEGSVNSLRVRESSLALTVESVTEGSVDLRIDGEAKLGKPYDVKLRKEPRSRGSEVRIIGRASFDREKGAFTRFDIAGAGRAWGCKMDYVDREVRIRESTRGGTESPVSSSLETRPWTGSRPTTCSTTATGRSTSRSERRSAGIRDTA